MSHHPLRPKTRGDCANGPRPCPWVSCRHHLAIEVAPRGRLVVSLPDPALWTEDTETCALDIADEGGVSAVRIAKALHLTKCRVGQILRPILADLAHSEELDPWQP
jgi:hypothetical protein